MRALLEWIHRLWGTLRPGRRDGELEDELRLHLELAAEDARQRPADENAMRAARMRAGGVSQAMDALRDQRSVPWLADLARDLRHALRTLRRSPGFTTGALLTLAIGIGANTAMFSIVNGVLLRPLPYADADRLVRVHQTNPEHGLQSAWVSVPDFEDWRQQARSFSAMGAYQHVPTIFSGTHDAIELETAFIIGGFFGTLGTPARLGRPLVEDDVRQAVPNAVISERLWRTHFATDPQVLGRPIVLWGRAYTVVGVMPASFRYPTPETDAWTPRSVLSEMEIGPNVRNQRTLEVVARLAEGVDLEEAGGELRVIAARLAAEHPTTNAGWGAAVVPLRSAIVGEVGRALVILLAAVGTVLLVVCVNLAILLLARGPARSREVAIRMALGANRGRIVRQLLAEPVLLGLAGGALGLVCSVWGVQIVMALSADTLPRVEDVRVDGRVIGFGFLLALITGMAFGLVPALRAAHANPHDNLEDGRGVVGRGQRLQRVLVVAELGMAVVLVVGAGLMARSFLELRTVHPGFDPERVLAVTMQMNLTGVDRPIDHIIQRREEWIERVAALPGVVDVGTITGLPLRDQCLDYVEFTRADGSGAPDGGRLRADNCLVSSGYLRTMGIPLLRGAPLPDRLAEGAPLPFLVSETAARRFWPGQNPLGRVVRPMWGGEAVVIGVVGDVRQLGLRQEPPPTVYFSQITGPRVVTTLVVRTDGDPLAWAGPIRQAVRELDSNQAIRTIATLRSVMSESIARDRFFTLLFGMFGGLALLLAAVGVYSVLAYSVAGRTQEIGVRMALGAERRTVIRMVIGHGARLVATGLVMGLVGSLVLTRVLASLLYQTNPYDLVTFTTVPAVLALAALLACALPAWRAARVDPTTALRAE